MNTSTISPETVALVNAHYPKYTILKKLASGMANVYVLTETSMKDIEGAPRVVLKHAHYDPNVPNSGAYYKAFLRENQLQYMLRHGNIPKLIEAPKTITHPDGTADAFAIMHYVNGGNLNEERRRGKPDPTTWRFNEKTVIALLKQVANVMRYLHHPPRDEHRPPVWYGDLKPTNLQWDTGERHIYLLDYGTAQHLTTPNGDTATTGPHPVGTNGYAAPEQFTPDTPLDLRSDIYAFGATGFELLTGVPPHKYTRVYDPAHKTLPAGKVAPPTIPLSVDDILDGVSAPMTQFIKACTSPDPADRPQSFEEVIYLLDNLSELDQVHQARMLTRRRITRTLFGAALACTLTAAAVAGGGLHARRTQYQDAVAAATQSGRPVDYVKAIRMQPSTLAPYFGLLDALTSDGEFTVDDENIILGLVNTGSTLQSLKTNPEYGQFAAQLGRAYWYFYVGEQSGTILSYPWLKDALDAGGGNQAQTQALLIVADFDRSIASNIASGQDAGTYKTYWDALTSLTEQGGGANSLGEVLQARVYLTLARTVSTYLPRLKADGIPQDSIQKQVDAIRTYLASTTPTNETTRQLYDELTALAGTLSEKITLTYQPVAGEAK